MGALVTAGERPKLNNLCRLFIYRAIAVQKTTQKDLIN